MTQGAEFSLRDATEILRLLDSDPNATFDIRRDGFRLQCVRGTAPSPAAPKQAGDAVKEEAPRHTMLKAPVTGRFRGEAALFAPGAQAVRVKAGSAIGRIKTGARVTVVTANVGGTVAHACVAPDGFVEYGQTLLVIDVA
jgi:biotin carboxyl carrier protein